jgi:hypothetical protein
MEKSLLLLYLGYNLGDIEPEVHDKKVQTYLSFSLDEELRFTSASLNVINICPKQ